MPAYRAALLYFSVDHALVHESDGLLVTEPDERGIERVRAIGPWSQLAPAHAHRPVVHWPGRIIAPGFVDLHMHYPQVDVIASPAEGLLPWLENYTFVQESRFADADHASEVARFFLDELRRPIGDRDVDRVVEHELLGLLKEVVDRGRVDLEIGPGDQVRIHCKKERSRGNVWKFSAEARVDETLCAEATYSAMILDR